MPDAENVKSIETLDSIWVFDQLDKEWQRAWIGNVFKRLKTVTLLPETTYSDNLSAIVSGNVYFAPYKRVSVFLEYTVSGVNAANPLVYLSVSPDGVGFYRCDYWKPLSSPGSYRERKVYDIGGDYLRVEVTNSGVDLGLISKIKIMVVLES